MTEIIYRRVLGRPIADLTVDSDILSGDGIIPQVLVEATKDLSTGSQITVAVPTNAIIMGIRFRNDTALTSGDGATDWRADLTVGGGSETIVTAQALTQNIKPVWAGQVLCSATTQIEITSDTGTLNGGTIRAEVRYVPPMDAYANV